MSNEFLKLITTWCLSLLIMDLVYVALASYSFNNAALSELLTVQNQSCIAIGVLLHYFLLASFCFSLSITIIQYFIFSKSFEIYKFIYLKAMAFSLSKYYLYLINYFSQYF